MRYTTGFARVSLALLVAASLCAAARADVTVQERTSFDFTLIKAHGTTTEMTTTDKQRRDTDFHCEGFMSLFCRNMESGEIIRLDRDVTWALEPKKKEYLETRFPTAAERQAAEQQVQAALEKMKQCPAMQTSATAPDTSRCEMSTPTIDVKQTDQHAMFAGHDTRLTQLALTQSCHNKETGDTCDFVITLDSWLSQEEIPGVADRKAFQGAYLHKLGFDDPNSALQKQVRQFLAPYEGSLKELSAKAADFKGYPLKTAFRVSFGGEHCAAAKGNANAQGMAAAGSNPVTGAGQAAGDAAASSAASAAGAEAASAAGKAAGGGVAGSILNSAAGTFGSKLVSGLFNKKHAAPASASTEAAPPSSPGMIQAMELTVETTSISSGAIAPDQFDVPPGWKLVTPKATPEKEFSCPKPGA
jgi:hypothetical protein